MGRALTLLGQRGAAAVEVDESELEALGADGASENDVQTVLTNLRLEAEAFTQDPGKGLNARATKIMRETLDRDTFSQMEMMEGRLIYYKGRGAALSVRGHAQADIEHVARIAEQSVISQAGSVNKEKSPIVDIAPLNVLPLALSQDWTTSQESDEDYDPDIHALISRLMDQKRKSGMKDDMITQMTRALGLFVEATGIVDIRHVQQRHCSRFVDVLQKLPRAYRKSPKDRSKSIQQIIKDAPEDAASLSVETINRNLEYLGQLFKKARTEGFANVTVVDLTSLRLRKTGRDRGKRKAFTENDVQSIFRHPIWRGFLNLRKWQEPGNRIETDGLYWMPLIAAYAGARRAELAGLSVDDIAILNQLPCFRFRDNANRSVKTFASERDVPIHPHLIRLGFMTHVEAQRRAGVKDVFPDMAPTGKEKWGDKIDHRFRKLVTKQVTHDREDKVFHSFRHYLTTQLKIAGVPREVRQDIVGHIGDGVTDEIYTDTSSPEVKLAALLKVPEIDLQAME